MTILVVAIAAGAVLVLVVPVRVDVELDMAGGQARPPIRTCIRWLCFAWRSENARRAGPERVRRARPRRRSARRLGPRSVAAALRTQGFVGRVRRLAVEVWRAVAPRNVDGWVRLGLDDPASTGMLYGAVCATGMLRQTAAWNLRLDPEFAGPVFAAHARFAWAVRPGAVLWPVGTFVASPVAWRAVFAAVRAT